MGSKISALTSAANLLGSTKKLALANAGFVVPDGWASAVAVPLTGSTSETALATIAIPAGAMGANGQLRIITLWSMTNNANNKYPRIRLGGISGTIYLGATQSSVASQKTQTIIRNRNSQSSQIGFAASGTLGAYGVGPTTVANVTSAVDTSAAQDLVISGQLATGTDTLTLESYTVEILCKA